MKFFQHGEQFRTCVGSGLGEGINNNNNNNNNAVEALRPVSDTEILRNMNLESVD